MLRHVHCHDRCLYCRHWWCCRPSWMLHLLERFRQCYRFCCFGHLCSWYLYHIVLFSSSSSSSCFKEAKTSFGDIAIEIDKKLLRTMIFISYCCTINPITKHWLTLFFLIIKIIVFYCYIDILHSIIFHFLLIILPQFTTKIHKQTKT